MQGAATTYNQNTTLPKPVYSVKSGQSKNCANYTYFGARYYDSDLSVWLSVDQMSDKYPSMSPYMYVGGNPVIITDPDGNDWFIDEETGNTYYNSRIGKDNMDELKGTKGEGYTWLGGNDMLGYTEDEMRQAATDPNGVIAPLADYVSAGLTHTDAYNNQSSYDEAHFSGENAEKLMSAFGYKAVTTQAFNYDKRANESIPVFQSYDISMTTGHFISIREKMSYVPKNFEIVSEKNTYLENQTNYVTPSLYIGLRNIYRSTYNYGPSGGESTFLTLNNNLTIDARVIQYFGSWNDFPKGINKRIDKYRPR